MKLKTSVTLSEDIFQDLQKQARKGESRSEVIERLLRQKLAELTRQEREERDLRIINKNAKALNEEASDVLEYQVET